MSDRRQVWATLAALLQRVETGLTATPTTAGVDPQLQEEVRRLGKAQFKANTLAESQAARWQEMAAALQATQAQNAELLAKLQQQQQAQASQELLAALLPALDGLDEAIASGRRYLARRDTAASHPSLTPAQARLVSPADRAVLAGWLDGLRLVRERLLAVLATGQVTPIAAAGQPFDPFLHRAVGTTADGQGQPPGTVISQERAGYRSPAGILRYADVVVYRPKDEV